MEKVLERKTVGRYLDPTNDFVFKRFFGTEEHKPSLISFLNAVLALKGNGQIKAVDFFSRDQLPLIPAGKFSVLYANCTDELGHQYIIEIESKAVKTISNYSNYSTLI